MFPEKDWSGTQTCFCDCFTFKLMSEKWTKGSFNLLGNFKSEELRLNPAVQKTLTVRSKQSQDRRLWWSVDSKCSRTCQQRTLSLSSRVVTWAALHKIEDSWEVEGYVCIFRVEQTGLRAQSRDKHAQRQTVSSLYSLQSLDHCWRRIMSTHVKTKGHCLVQDVTPVQNLI